MASSVMIAKAKASPFVIAKAKANTVMINDVKNPNEKKGNCRLEALGCLPEDDDRKQKYAFIIVFNGCFLSSTSSTAVVVCLY